MPEKIVLGNAELWLGDCSDILEDIKTDSINWCVTSPPYNLNKAYHTSPNASTKTNKSMVAKYSDWYEDDMDEVQYQDGQKSIIKQLIRVCTDSIFYNHRIRYAWHSRNKNAPVCKVYHPMHWLIEFPIWAEIIWYRCGGSTPTGRYQQAHEFIYQIGRPRRTKKSLGMLDVWSIPPDSGKGHVCSFPEKLVENCLEPHTMKNETVIDPYMGSGTTGVVCHKMNLKFIGCEKDPRIFEAACKRIEDAQRQSRLFE